MRRLMRLAAFTLVANFGVACTSPPAQKAPSPSASASPSRSTPSASPSALAAFPVATDVTCPDLSPYGLNRYLERPSDPNRHEAVLCDASQLDHPRALHDLDSAQTIGFVTGTLIGYVQQSGISPSDATASIKTLDLTNQQSTTVVASQAGFVGPVSWSHDQSKLAFTTYAGSSIDFWLKRGSGVAVPLVPAIPVLGRGGAEGDENLVAFSPDDQYVLFVDTAVSRLQVFRTSDGGVAYTAPSGSGGFRTMAVWARSGNQMYFRNDSGIYRWDATSGISSFAPGVKWEFPAFSPDGRHLVYTVWDAAGTTHIVIRDMSNGTTKSSPTMRLSSEFLSNVVLLERVTKACDNQGPCGPFALTGDTRTLRIDTGAEGQLPMPAGWGLDAFVQGH